MPLNRSPVLAIAAPVRGEAVYLLEWIAYHRALGVERFLLADNGGSDGTSALLAKLESAGLALRFDWRDQLNFQLAFYRQALEAARDVADGVFLIDVDEFLRPSAEWFAEGKQATAVAPSTPAASAIAQAWLSDPDISAVALNWAIYGSSGRAQPGDGLVIERFTRRGPQDFSVNRHAKAFVRVASCAGPADNPHAVTLRSGRYVDSRGEEVVWDTSLGFKAGITTSVVWGVLRVDHFVVKSSVEFAIKREHRNLIRPEHEWEHYFDLHDRNDVEDPVPLELVERTKREMERIASLLDCAGTSQ
jgi:Glycosyl transferase family 2